MSDQRTIGHSASFFVDGGVVQCDACKKLGFLVFTEPNRDYLRIVCEQCGMEYYLGWDTLDKKMKKTVVYR